MRSVTWPQMSVSELRDIVRQGQPTALRGHVPVMHLLGAFLAKIYHTTPSIRPSIGPSITNGRPPDIFITNYFRKITGTLWSLLKLDDNYWHFAQISPSVCTNITKRQLLCNNTHSSVREATKRLLDFCRIKRSTLLKVLRFTQYLTL